MKTYPPESTSESDNPAPDERWKRLPPVTTESGLRDYSGTPADVRMELFGILLLLSKTNSLPLQIESFLPHFVFDF